MKIALTSGVLWEGLGELQRPPNLALRTMYCNNAFDSTDDNCAEKKKKKGIPTTLNQSDSEELDSKCEKLLGIP